MRAGTAKASPRIGIVQFCRARENASPIIANGERKSNRKQGGREKNRRILGAVLCSQNMQKGKVRVPRRKKWGAEAPHRRLSDCKAKKKRRECGLACCGASSQFRKHIFLSVHSALAALLRPRKRAAKRTLRLAHKRAAADGFRDSRTGHHDEKSGVPKHPTVVVTRTGIEPMLQP